MVSTQTWYLFYNKVHAMSKQYYTQALSIYNTLNAVFYISFIFDVLLKSYFYFT